MQRNLLATSKLFAVLVLFFTCGCTKIDTTTLGQDLIPAVDNVHTFADTLEIFGTQGTFIDSTRVGNTEYHPLGIITNDPVFGTTKADLYLELKPGFFPFYFGAGGDTIDNVIDPAVGANGTSFDSAVLCLSYKTFFGDTNTTQHLKVYSLDNTVSNFKDSSYRLDFVPNRTFGETLIGEADIAPTTLRNYTFFKGSKKDSINNQVRIKLSYDYLRSLMLNRDSSVSGIFHSDSMFKDKIKGFAVKADNGNGLFYIAVNETATRLEVHYKKIKNNVKDTSYSAFYFSTGVSSTVSAQATHLERNRSVGEINSPQTDALYIQTTPGTYANLSIPGLSALQNSIIHRAELVVEQIPGTSPVDQLMMLPPSYLYVDLIDTNTTSTYKFKPVYYDLSPTATYLPDNITYFFPSSGIDFSYYGGYLRVKDAGAGVPLYYYTFNLSRYVQHIVTDGLYNYNLRLYAPSHLNYYGLSVQYKDLIADGRIKIGNGNHPTHKMYMRVVYSKL